MARRVSGGETCSSVLFRTFSSASRVLIFFFFFAAHSVTLLTPSLFLSLALSLPLFHFLSSFGLALSARLRLARFHSFVIPQSNRRPPFPAFYLGVKNETRPETRLFDACQKQLRVRKSDSAFACKPPSPCHSSIRPIPIDREEKRPSYSIDCEDSTTGGAA